MEVDAMPDVLEQYGCGPIRFSGNKREAVFHKMVPD